MIAAVAWDVTPGKVILLAVAVGLALLMVIAWTVDEAGPAA